MSGLFLASWLSVAEADPVEVKEVKKTEELSLMNHLDFISDAIDRIHGDYPGRSAQAQPGVCSSAFCETEVLPAPTRWDGRPTPLPKPELTVVIPFGIGEVAK